MIFIEETPSFELLHELRRMTDSVIGSIAALSEGNDPVQRATDLLSEISSLHQRATEILTVDTLN